MADNRYKASGVEPTTSIERTWPFESMFEAIEFLKKRAYFGWVDLRLTDVWTGEDIDMMNPWSEVL